MCVDVLPACISEYLICARCPQRPEDSYQIDWDWSYSELGTATWMLGIKHGSSARAANTPNPESSLQPPDTGFWLSLCLSASWHTLLCPHLCCLGQVAWFCTFVVRLLNGLNETICVALLVQSKSLRSQWVYIHSLIHSFIHSCLYCSWAWTKLHFKLWQIMGVTSCDMKCPQDRIAERDKNQGLAWSWPLGRGQTPGTASWHHPSQLFLPLCLAVLQLNRKGPCIGFSKSLLGSWDVWDEDCSRTKPIPDRGPEASLDRKEVAIQSLKILNPWLSCPSWSK